MEAGFNDTRCNSAEYICQYEPLQYTCVVTGSTENSIIVVDDYFWEFILYTNNTIILSGYQDPELTVQSHVSRYGSFTDVRITLIVESALILASILYPLYCGEVGQEYVQSSVCPVALCKSKNWHLW